MCILSLYFHAFRYKMVYDKLPPARNNFISPTSDDSHHDVSMETEESDDDTMVEGRNVTAVSPQESQIVVRRNRRGKRRVLAESYLTSPEAADSEHQAKPSERQTKLPEHETKLSEQTKSQGLCVDGRGSENILSIHSKNSTAQDDATFKRPGNTAPVSVNRKLHEIVKGSTGYQGDNENFDDILAALNDSDDESMMMEINTLPSFAAFEDSTSGKNSATKNASVTPLKNLSNTSYDRNSEVPNFGIKPNLSKSLQLNSNKRQVSGSPHSLLSSSSCDTSGSKQISSNDRNDQLKNSEYTKTEMLKTNNGQCAGKRFMVEPNTGNVQQSKLGLSSGQKCNVNVGPKTNNSDAMFRTNLNPNLNSASSTWKNNNHDPGKLYDCKTLTTKAEPRAANKATNVSPIFPPLATITSSRDNTSYTHVLPEKTTGQVSSSEQTKLDTSKAATETSVNSTGSSSPALTVCEYFFL